MKSTHFKFHVNPLKRLIIPGMIVSLVAIIGVIGYIKVEGWSLIDAIYMVVITLSTVGFREVHDLSPLGRILTIFIIFAGVGSALYAAGLMIEMVMEGQIVGYRRRKKMERDIEEMKDHYIICGFGRVGHQVAVELLAEKIPFVVIDPKPETAEEMGASSIPYIIGDMTKDKTLLEGGIKHAKGLIAAADSDTDNVFVTLSARVLNPKLTIIARAGNLDSEEKLKKAGANRVLSPYFIAGKRMAQMVTKPTAVDYLDTVLYSENIEMEMRELKAEKSCHLLNKTLGEAQVRQRSGAYIVTIKKGDGEFILQPGANSKIEEGDILVAIGTPKQLDKLVECMK